MAPGWEAAAARKVGAAAGRVEQDGPAEPEAEVVAPVTRLARAVVLEL